MCVTSCPACLRFFLVRTSFGSTCGRFWIGWCGSRPRAMRRPGCPGDAQWSPALAGLSLFTAAPDAIHPRGIRVADPAVRTNGCGGLLWRYHVSTPSFARTLPACPCCLCAVVSCPTYAFNCVTSPRAAKVGVLVGTSQRRALHSALLPTPGRQGRHGSSRRCAPPVDRPVSATHQVRRLCIRRCTA
jgi:hypothetical protein